MIPENEPPEGYIDITGDHVSDSKHIATISFAGQSTESRTPYSGERVDHDDMMRNLKRSASRLERQMRAEHSE